MLLELKFLFIKVESKEKVCIGSKDIKVWHLQSLCTFEQTVQTMICFDELFEHFEASDASWDFRSILVMTKSCPKSHTYVFNICSPWENWGVCENAKWHLNCCDGVSVLANVSVHLLANVHLARVAQFNQTSTLRCVFGLYVINCQLYSLYSLFAIFLLKKKQSTKKWLEKSAKWQRTIVSSYVEIISQRNRCTVLKHPAVKCTNRSLVWFGILLLFLRNHAVSVI